MKSPPIKKERNSAARSPEQLSLAASKKSLLASKKQTPNRVADKEVSKKDTSSKAKGNTDKISVNKSKTMTEKKEKEKS